jgi:hypothetical protein
MVERFHQRRAQQISLLISLLQSGTIDMEIAVVKKYSVGSAFIPARLSPASILSCDLSRLSSLCLFSSTTIFSLKLRHLRSRAPYQVGIWSLKRYSVNND